MTYEELVEKVRVVDAKAANYMEGDAKKLSSFDLEEDAGSLDCVFEWGQTPQGSDYWWKIEDAVLGVDTYVGE